MPSRHYQALTRNIAELERQFLCFKKRSDGTYTKRELYQCRAYIAFCHSEIEAYLENSALNIVSKSEILWRDKGKVTNASAAMVAYRGPKEFSLPTDPSAQSPKKRFASIIENAISAQKVAIGRNHGIARSNLAELFIPIGFSSEKFEETLLIQLDNLGRRRGDHVHQQSNVSLKKVRDPFDDERRDIQFLVAELVGFDATVRGLR